jgi:hypothetical protein
MKILINIYAGEPGVRGDAFGAPVRFHPPCIKAEAYSS